MDFVEGFSAGMTKGGASPPRMAYYKFFIVRFEYIKPYIKGLLERKAFEYKKKKPGRLSPARVFS
jgi:hypothetical protein